VSKVACAVRGGPRYESPELKGVSHLIKNAMFQGNSIKTKLRMTREIQLSAGSLDCSLSRELITRRGVVLRDRLENLVDLIYATMNPVYNMWEMAEVKATCISDLANLDCVGKNLEMLHEVAFRSGLGNSLYCAEAKLGGLNADAMLAFINQTQVGSGITFAATNCNHDDLVEMVKALDLPGGDVEAPPTQQYHGGEARAYTCGGTSSLHDAHAEVATIQACFLLNRIAHTNSGVTHASLVGPGAGLTDPALPAFLVLSNALKAPGMVPWGSGTVSSALSRAGASAEVLNLSYSDAGLFGVHVATTPGATTGALRAARDVALGVSADDVERAKTQVKAGIMFAASETDGLLDDVLNQVAHTGAYVSAGAAADAIDAVTVEAVQAAAQQAFGGKATLITTSDTTYAPYLDEL